MSRIVVTRALLAVIVAGCAGEPTVTDAPVSTAAIQLTAPAASLLPGATLQLQAIPMSASGKQLTARSAQVLWSVSSAAVASVSAAGLLTGVAAGQVTVMASQGGASATLTVTVNNPAPQVTSLSPASVVAGSAAFTLSVLGGNFISTSVVLFNGSNRPTTFVSQGELRAQIAASDIANAGSATIGVLSGPPGGGTASATLTIVPPVPVARVSVDPPSGRIVIGNTLAFAAHTYDATNTELFGRSVSWQSSAPSIASVSASGVASGTAAGNAYIVAVSEGKRDSALVTVGVPAIVVGSPNVSFSALTPQNPIPDSQAVAVTSAGVGSLTQLSVDSAAYTAGQTQGWLHARLGPLVGGAATLTLHVTSSTLAVGNYSATVTLRSTQPGVVATSIVVTLTVTQLTTLAVGAGGNGSGQVTSIPSGINCTITNGTVGAGGCSATFAMNTTVTLSATAQTGNTFSGWNGGGCTGTAACTLQMTSSTTVTATFTPATPSPYSDGFEGASINSFWTPTVVFGTIALSTTQAHSGSQSVAFTSTSSANLLLQHKYSIPAAGTFSVWLYDSAPGQATAYEMLTIFNSTRPGLLATIGTQDFDATCYMARLDDGSGHTQGQNANCGSFPQTSTTSVRRTLGWHLLQISIAQNGVAFSIDGQQLFTATGAFLFDTVELSLSGPHTNNTVAFFDDFFGR